MIRSLFGLLQREKGPCDSFPGLTIHEHWKKWESCGPSVRDQVLQSVKPTDL